MGGPDINKSRTRETEYKYNYMNNMDYPCKSPILSLIDIRTRIFNC